VSNSLAIAAATRGLCAKLSEAIARSDAPAVGARVSALRPNALNAADPSVNVFLLQVSPNAALRNADLPTRRAAGELIQRPTLALDLHFLLTFTGDDAELVPQRLLGLVLPALHASPTLSARELIALTQANAPSYLDSSDLAQQVELVRFSLGAMNLEELSKLWSVFFQTQYLLSVPVQASVVLLEAPLLASPAAPVLERGIFSGTSSPPVIRALSPAFTTLRDAQGSVTLRIVADFLQTGAIAVRFGDAPARAAKIVERDQLAIELPDDLRAGVLPVRLLVSQTFQSADRSASFPLESAPVALAIMPRIRGAAVVAERTVTLNVEPPVGRTQAVKLTLERRTAGTQRVAIAWVAPASASADESFSVVTFRLPSQVEVGRYAVQLEVDGIASGLQTPFDQLPTVDVP
jgi:hypothetical protein